MFKKLKELWNKFCNLNESIGQGYIDYEYDNYEDKYIKEINSEMNKNNENNENEEKKS